LVIGFLLRAHGIAGSSGGKERHIRVKKQKRVGAAFLGSAVLVVDAGETQSVTL